MDPTAIAGIIGGASNLMGSVLGAGTSLYQSHKNRKAQEKQNKKDWEQTVELYEKQRADALADWAAQNAYNHPLEQMNRLRQAGLNPHLVYGKGADATADAIRSVGMSQVKRTAPQSSFDPSTLNQVGSSIGQGITQMYDLRAKQAQTDNVTQSTALMQQEALFKQANTAKTVADTASTQFELEQAKELKDSVIENAKLQNEKLRADTAYTLDNNQRQALESSNNLKYTAEKIITEKIAHAKDQATIDLLKAQLDSVRQNQNIATYEEELSRMGIHKNDPWYFRALMNLVEGNIKAPIEKGINRLKTEIQTNPHTNFYRFPWE